MRAPPITMISSSSPLPLFLLLLVICKCLPLSSSASHGTHLPPLLGSVKYHEMRLYSLTDLYEPTNHHPLEEDMEGWAESGVDEAGQVELKLRLMHRDAAAPLTIMSMEQQQKRSAEEVWEERMRRDRERVRKVEMAAAAGGSGVGFTGPVMSGLKQGSGEYFTRVGVGTPAKQALMVVDTGSDIMWLQCSPCSDCYDQSGPIFDPSSSRSFRKLPCSSPICGLLELHGCSPRSNLCLYQVEYGDGSFTQGDFVMESLTFRRATIRNVAMGCGHDNEGLFAGASGLFGLGGGSLSFVSQFGRQQYRKVFSYCLMDRDKQGMSTLTFGTLPKEVSSFTPLLRNPNLETFYYVALSGISVGGNPLAAIPAAAFRMDAASGEGGVIIDSGTSVSRLVEVAYGPLRSAFRAATRSLPFVGGFSLFDTCYDLSGRSSVTLPTLSLHFQGGASMDLPPANYFVPVNAKGTYCLAFASTSGQLSIIGNIQQQGFRVVFDAAGSRLGFAAGQC